MTGVVLVIALANLLFALRLIAAALQPYEEVVAQEGEAELPGLSIIVPARDEERQIERCVRSLLALRHPDFEVIVVDDCSGDATPAILSRIAAEDSRLQLVSGEPLPAGWVGKPWAVDQGQRIARGSWLLFTDADTVHDADGAASVQRAAIAHNLDALSVLTDQTLVSLSERALMPFLFLAIFAGTGPIGDVGNPEKPDVALFNGQYILTTRRAYDAIGGHAAVRNEIAEDLELARRFKRDGRFRIALVASHGVASTRMYRSLAEIWRGFTKNFALGVRGRPGWAAGALVFFACVSPVAPLLECLLLASHQWLGAAILGVAMAFLLATMAYEMRVIRQPLLVAACYPIGVAFTVAVLSASMMLFASGRGVQWRGRRYA